ncbi:MAG: energy transducer TonB [Sphingomonas bacterium]|nr:energy transducer TonB [Sphingomonas bacterium]
MSYANRKEMGSNRTVAIIIVALIHVGLGYVLVSGLAYNVVKQAAEDLKTFDVEDEPPPPPEEPPPPPEDSPLPPPPQVSAPPPLVRTITQAPMIQTTPNIQPVIITPRADPVPPRPPAPPPPRPDQSARAKGSLPGLFSSDDYPPGALRNEEQGTTAVSLAISADGRVSGCNVTSSSGSTALDTTTCSILKRRARFTPARDTSGTATTGTSSARIKWVLPDN